MPSSCRACTHYSKASTHAGDIPSQNQYVPTHVLHSPLQVKYPQPQRSTHTANRFDESADQVKKLLDRDRKEVQEFGDIGGAFKAEFDEGNDEPSPSSSTPPAAAASTSKPAASASAPTSMWGGY